MSEISGNNETILVLITTDVKSLATQTRFAANSTIGELKAKLETITGASDQTMKLQLLDNNREVIGQLEDNKLPLESYLSADENRLNIHVIDNNPKAELFEELDQVKKFELSQEDKDKMTNSVLAFKMRTKFGRFGHSRSGGDRIVEDKPMSGQSSSKLTPVFTRFRHKLSVSPQSPNDDSENSSLVANTSIDSLMNSSLMLTTNEIIPLKRRKSISLTASPTKKSIPFVRCHSANEAQIMKAVQISSADPSLIGDFSKSYALPLIQGKHQDLKSISVDVLAQVLEGHYNHLIEDLVIVDCRYPYEYNGGHIRGAKNIFSREAILQEFLRNKNEVPAIRQNTEKRRILVFHCEFSSERGPTLYVTS